MPNRPKPWWLGCKPWLSPLGQTSTDAPASTTATPTATALNNGSSAPQAPGVALAELANLRPELEFWLPAHRLSVRTVDALCQAHVLPGTAGRAASQRAARHTDGLCRPGVRARAATGCWTTKPTTSAPTTSAIHRPALASRHGPPPLRRAGHHHLLALHRLLRQRLGDGYQPAQHLGGAVITLCGIHGPTQGVCLLPPPGRTRPA